MADELNNKKNIDDSKRSLDDFNNALRESIDYAKQLSKAVNSLPSSLNLSERMNNDLVKGLKSYNEVLSDTLKLSNKAAKGKATEKEITEQLKKLETEYTKLKENNNKSFETGNRFSRAQRNLQKEINQLTKLEEISRREIVKKQLREEEISRIIGREEDKRYKNVLAKKTSIEKIKALKAEQASIHEIIKDREKDISANQKAIAQKQKEKEQINGAIKAYKALIELKEKEIEELKDFLEEYKKLSFLDKLRSKDVETFNEGLKETLSFIGSIGTAFKPVVDFAFKISDQTTKLQKNLVLSQEDARALRQDFNAIAVDSNDAAINTARLVEANAALGQQLGFSSEFTADLNVQFVKLTKQLGLSEEAAGGLAKLSIATGATLEDTKNIAYETVQGLSSQYGIQLTQREVLEEIGKLSGQTLAMFKANPRALAEAVAQAKLLGTNLNTVRKQAASLLDFESSIENELQAELLTGQQINLERARSAALTGDMTTAMQELNSQNIDFNKFSNMNVIAQDKVAAAMGLTSDELSDQLLKQQYMNMSREEVVALAGEEVAKRVEALSAQDKFNLAMEKLQDIIGNLVGGPLGRFVDLVASAANNSWVLYSALSLMAGLSFTKLVVGLAAAAVQAKLLAVESITVSSALTFGAAAIGIAAAIGALLTLFFSSLEEAEATPTGDMFSSKGKTIVSTKEGGLFELSGNDEFAAHPKLGDMLSNSNQQTIVAQDNSALLEELRAIKAEMATNNKISTEIARKDPKIAFNAPEASTYSHKATYNLA